MSRFVSSRAFARLTIKALQVSILVALVGVGLLWVSSGRIDAVLPSGGAHLATVATYLLLFLYLLRYFEGRTSAVEALGFSLASVVSAVYFYEFLFKVSFPLADPRSPGRLEWLLTADLVPAARLFLTASVFLVTYRWWNTKSRLFLVALMVFVALWVGWIVLAYPLSLEAYELDWGVYPATMAFNVLTKASGASLYAAVLCRRVGRPDAEPTSLARPTRVPVEKPAWRERLPFFLVILAVVAVLSYWSLVAPPPPRAEIANYDDGSTCEQWSWVGGYHCSEMYFWGEIEVMNEGGRESTFWLEWRLEREETTVERVCWETPPIKPGETGLVKEAFGPFTQGEVDQMVVGLGC